MNWLKAWILTPRGRWAPVRKLGRQLRVEAITLGEWKPVTDSSTTAGIRERHAPVSPMVGRTAFFNQRVPLQWAMHHLGVPTTRALSLVTTGEKVVRDVMYDGRPAPEPGAIVCRVAESFIRFGSFEIHAMSGDVATLRILVENTIRRHFPGHSSDTDEGLVEWLREVVQRTAETISHWMRVGFVHGVLNTDNMSIHGLTIDYGPYGWLEGFDPGWTPNNDARTRRYRYGQQAQIGAWNCSRLIEAISPLIEDTRRLNGVLDSYYESYKRHSSMMWAEKLGLGEFEEEDGELVTDLTTNLQLTETDMTILFRMLSTIDGPNLETLLPAFYEEGDIPSKKWNTWLDRWWDRVAGSPDRVAMLRTNPKFVIRNWMAQLAIDAAEKGDYSGHGALRVAQESVS